VTSGLSIVGFPFGITGGGGLGVWVQGTIATEPSLDFDGMPRFLIDSRTRPGQSGSPVLAYHAGGALPMQGGARQSLEARSNNSLVSTPVASATNPIWDSFGRRRRCAKLSTAALLVRSSLL